jgi:uncharacterized protein HemX
VAILIPTKDRQFFEAVMFAGLSALASALIPIATVAAIGYGVYSVSQQTREAKKARSTGEKLAAEQLAAQQRYAGEYLQLSKSQMELQSQQRQIETLADVITEGGEQRQVVTLPPAKQYSPIDEINTAIGRLFGRN